MPASEPVSSRGCRSGPGLQGRRLAAPDRPSLRWGIARQAPAPKGQLVAPLCGASPPGVPRASPSPADSVAPVSLADDPPPGAGQEPAIPPESSPTPSSWPGLDRLGYTQAIGGLALGLIALFSSYDHITVAGYNLQLQQQWGIVFIAASVATVFIDAQLATRSRLRDAHARLEDRQNADRERYFASRERNLAGEERQRAARERKRQRESLERLDQATLLSARVQLDPSEDNRARLSAFLTLLGQRQRDEPNS